MKYAVVVTLLFSSLAPPLPGSCQTYPIDGLKGIDSVAIRTRFDQTRTGLSRRGVLSEIEGALEGAGIDVVPNGLTYLHLAVRAPTRLRGSWYMSLSVSDVQDGNDRRVRLWGESKYRRWNNAQEVLEEIHLVVAEFLRQHRIQNRRPDYVSSPL